MELDLKKPYIRYFYEISQIPHVSYHEKAISDYLVNFAQKRGLRCCQDQWNNVVIYKEGSAGCEKQPPLMLQAHMDMVGAKEEWSDHDFLKDPLDLRVKDGFLYAEGTTLGADDGHGVSSILALLSDEDLVHPPLECVFTVQEETGLEGAMKLDASWFHSKRMIGLDANGETRTVISANGGCTATVSMQLSRTKTQAKTYRIFLSGLLGGHSGKDSFAERGNGIQLLARVVGDLWDQDPDMALLSMEGGTKDNVIPDSAQAVIASAQPMEQLEKRLEESVERICQRLQYSDGGLQGQIVPTDDAGDAMTAQDGKRLLALLILLPSGLQHRDLTREGHALSSANLGVLKIRRDEASVVVSLRSCVPPEIDFMQRKIVVLSQLAGATASFSQYYPGYNFRKVSPLRDAYARYTKETLGRDLELFAGNGGNEMGVMMSKIEGLDVISMGPWVYDNHTPRERMNLASFDLVYHQLRGFIEMLAKTEETV